MKHTHGPAKLIVNEVEKYVEGEGSYLVKSDGTTIDVARNSKEVLFRKLLPYKE